MNASQPLPAQPTRTTDWYTLVSLAAILIAVVTFSIMDPKDSLSHLKVIFGYALLFLMFSFGLKILIDMIRGQIDLSQLISDQGTASISRFQFLIFTFVIAFSFFLVAVSTDSLPPVPGEVLTLLGISATTFAVSKGIEVSHRKVPPGAGDNHGTSAEDE
ncbi:MAG TPA: hypothetical protein VHR45_20785 [Thermoanaerobaculia bacterium]|nr:hypothetical protein [Thermoanaerobaculia bacterium]